MGKENTLCEILDLRLFFSKVNPRIIESTPTVKEVIDGLSFDHGSRKKVSELSQIGDKTLASYHREENYIDFNNFLKIERLYGKLINIHKIKGERQGLIITIPDQVNENLAELFGLILSNGRIRGNRMLDFIHRTPSTRDRFAAIIQSVFNVKPVEIEDRKVVISRINCRLISDFLVWMGYPSENRSMTCEIPKFVLYGNSKFKKSYLAGFIAGDGRIRKNSLDIITSSQKMNNSIVILLREMEIDCTSEIDNTKKRNQFTISIQDWGIIQLQKVMQEEFSYYKIQNLLKLVI